MGVNLQMWGLRLTHSSHPPARCSRAFCLSGCLRLPEARGAQALFTCRFRLAASPRQPFRFASHATARNVADPLSVQTVDRC